ncbi:Replication termination factor 2 [Halotydeus destructor]|nr:Replication termination factor 2 [Halotydeus destructor]
MGCDGGTIPRRDELVKTKKKPEEKDKDADLAAKWQYCALSCTKLQAPIVSCELGRLYNKESIIEYLLSKDTFTVNVANHIRNLKDIIELKLTEKKGYEDTTGNGGQYVDYQNSRYMCPVVGLEMNGKHKFIYMQKCGCVLSERALKEVKSENCHKCGLEYAPEDVIVINGTEEEVKVLQNRMEERRAKLKAEKKAKKRKSEPDAEAPSAAKAQALQESKSTTGVDTASKTTKVSTDALLTGKAKADYSVSKDPNASETYKSIFTSHKSAKDKPKNNWVTYNPLYF